MLFNFPCVILAGGKSSRMGEDKALLPFGGKDTLIEYQIERLRPLFKSLHVSMKSKKIDLDVPLLLDENDSESSPMVAFAKILSSFDDTYIFILSVDTPFVGEKEIGRMATFTKYDDAIIAKNDEFTHPLCGFYHSSLADKAKELVKDEKHAMRFLLDTISTIYIPFSQSHPFTNLNHKDEYEAAKQSLHVKKS